MSRDKQIEERNEIAEIISNSFDHNGEKWDASDFEWSAHCVQMAGYRKIYDDHQRQCTCYALGCQMAEELKRKVAREIFEEIESEKIFLKDHVGNIGIVVRLKDIAELKKKYTEGGE